MDNKDRLDGTPRMERLRQIPPEMGKFLSILGGSCPNGEIIEIGTSAGYSTLWLSLAARILNKKIKTFELLSAKILLAKETFDFCSIDDVVELVEGDALINIKNIENIGFCFLDCEKELYKDLYHKIVPKLVSGGLLVCDNAINHREILQNMRDEANSDPRVDCIMVPIGKGEFICRKL